MALDKIEDSVPTSSDISLILDNYGSHETVPIRASPAKWRSHHVHTNPTCKSLTNLVERRFAALTNVQIHRGVRRILLELESAIESLLAMNS